MANVLGNLDRLISPEPPGVLPAPEPEEPSPPEPEEPPDYPEDDPGYTGSDGGPRTGPGRKRQNPEFVWPTPLDFLADPNGEAPELKPEHIPPAINDFVFDTAARMGVDPTSVALSSIVSCASVAPDRWQVQPKRYDYSWLERPCLWGAIVGLPSILKTPIIRECTRPIDMLEAEARAQYADEMRVYKQQVRLAKADKSGETAEPIHPKLRRYLIEGATVDAITEVLRDDDEAHQYAPAGKVLSRHDEMSEFFANLDRYRAGGKGGGDRGAYLRLYNGGRYTIDRIGRGTFAISNWSACKLGGIQPGPIQAIAKNSAEDGLLARFIYAVPGPQEAGVDRKPGTEARERYNALFPALTALNPSWTPDGKHIQSVAFHADAHQHREAVDDTIRVMALMPDVTPQLLAAYGKWPGLFARVALTFHLIELADAAANNLPPPYHHQVITEETARRAAAFMLDIALPHLLRAHKLMFSTEQAGHASWIAGYILAERLKRITSRDVVRAYTALKAPEAKDELLDVMASLTTVGWLEPETPTNAMKPVHAWAVNPAVHVLFAARAERENNRRAKAREEIAAHVEALRRKQDENEAE